MKIIRPYVHLPLMATDRFAWLSRSWVTALVVLAAALLTTGLPSTVIAQQVVAVNAGSFASDGVLAPDTVGAAFGVFKTLNDQNYSASTTPLPTTLGGVKLTIGGTDAGLLFTSNSQINFVVPGTLADGTVTITVTNSDSSIRTNTLTIARTSPGIFTLLSTGLGLPIGQTTNGTTPLTNVYNNDGSPRDVDPGTAALPNFLVLYGTGFRNAPAVNPNDANRVAEAVTATIQGVPAEVTYAGPQGSLAGLDQINLRIPRQVSGLGLVKVRLSVGGRVANVVVVRMGGNAAPVTSTDLATQPNPNLINGALTTGSQVQAAGDGRTYFFDAYSYTQASGVTNPSLAISLNSTQFDAAIALYRLETGGNLTFIAADDQTGALGNGGDAPGNGNALLAVSLPGPGTYLIFVTSADGEPDATGSYSLKIQIGQVQAIAYGANISAGAIANTDLQTSAGDYLDVYSFAGNQGDQVQIKMTSTVFDSFLILNRSNGDLQTFDDNNGGGAQARDALISLTLPETGTFYILATPLEPGRTGAYTLTLTKLGPGTSADRVEAAESRSLPGRALSDDNRSRRQENERRFAARHVVIRD